MLSAEHITIRYGRLTAVEDLSFRLREGQWLMLVGPNGAGKSSLIEAAARGVPYEGTFRWLEGSRQADFPHPDSPQSGFPPAVSTTADFPRPDSLRGEDLRSLKPALLARRIGFLSQKNQVTYAYTVEEVVALGRYAYRSGLFSGRDEGGEAAVDRALEMTGLTALRGASMLTLSGGETQRVFLAQVFAQEPRLLVLDEPANHLDLNFQKQIFSLIRRWLDQPGRAVLSVVHDLSLARRFGTHALLMDHGKAVARGPINEVMTPELLRRVYGMDVHEWMRELLSPW